MTSTDSYIKITSPFLEGIAKYFDFASFFDDIALPPLQDGNPILYDWQAIGLDNNNSIKIKTEELLTFKLFNSQNKLLMELK
jgi:hypothetical protein